MWSKHHEDGPLDYRSEDESSDEESLLSSNDESSSYEDLTSPCSSDEYDGDTDDDEEADKTDEQIEAAISAELDEVDDSINEVNAILGAMPLPSAGVPIGDKVQPATKLLTVHKIYLSVETEMLKKPTVAYIKELRQRKACIVRSPNHFTFPQVGIEIFDTGLSMSLVGQEDGASYFTFDHNPDYQAMHQEFMNILNPQENVPLDESQRKIHIEGLIEGSDFILKAEEYKAALSIYEQIIAFLQSLFHPTFDIADQSVRLEYKYLENRPFHVVLFKYMYLLSGEGFNKTAVELAKLLMNLDPIDPLGINFIIDTFALKANEYRWLVAFIDDYTLKNDTVYLFNFKFSNALSHYILLLRGQSDDTSLPDTLLQLTIVHYPTVTIELLKAIAVDNDLEQRQQGLFGSDFQKTYITDPFLEIAITTYAKIVAPKWREPIVKSWFLSNVAVVSTRYEKEPLFKTRVNKIAASAIKQFSRPCPIGIRRHLLLLKPMSKFIAKYDMPAMVQNRPWDPHPPSDSVNRYNYSLTDIDPRYYTALFNLLLGQGPAFIPPDLQGPEFAGIGVRQPVNNDSASRRMATPLTVPEYHANTEHFFATIIREPRNLD